MILSILFRRQYNIYEFLRSTRVKMLLWAGGSKGLKINNLPALRLCCRRLSDCVDVAVADLIFGVKNLTST